MGSSLRFTINRAAKLSAFGAAAALVASGVVVAPAFAAEAAPKAELDQVAAEAFQVPGVVAVVTDGNGIQIKVADESGEGGLTALAAPVDGVSAEAIAAKFSNVEVVPGEEISAISADEVVGGAGYLSGSGDTLNSSCSLGFSAWDASGAPALVSAGHCMTEFGGSTFGVLSRPSTEPAVTGSEETVELLDGELLGEYVWGQFGGPGSSVDGQQEDATDISFLGNINENYTLLPAVTDWTGAPSDDHASSTLPVRSYGSAQVNDTITTSGRTTGAGQGTVTEVGYANISGHIVYGFGAENNNSEDFAMPGDSGGGVLVGDKAVGVASGGGVGNFIWVTDLPEALRIASANGHDYTIALDLIEPAVDPKTTAKGDVFEGTTTAGATVTIGGDIEATATADENGKFSFAAPDKVGSFDITLSAKKGFDTSETVNTTVKTVDTPAAPKFTSPEGGSVVADKVSKISGTGVVGAEVTLTGDVEATTTVAEDGTWSVEVNLSAGSYEVAATQTRGGLVSKKSTLKFQVVATPGAPEITSPANDSSTTESAPSITGTGVAGATVTLSGDAEGTATVNEDGKYSIPTELGFGKYTVGVSQTVSGLESETRWLTFSVVPGAPTVVTPGDGNSYVEGKLPAVIGTSPIDGAEISVSLETADGNGLIGETTVEGGNWMVEFPEALAAGEYTISVTQGIDGVTSAAATSTFTITPENAGNGGGSDDEQPAEPTPAPSPGDDDGSDPTPAPNPGDDNDGGLAPTGATQSETVLPLAGGAALLMAAGAALLFVRRKTRA
jgi:LPXTG-motif cell wall-anchored protein